MSLQEKAIILAKKAHEGQKRKEAGEDYFMHCYRVMQTIELYTDDDAVLAAAVLHDTFEDSEIKLPEISHDFSPMVSFIVRALSKNKKYDNHDSSFRIKMYINRFAKGALSNPWIMFIKIADQIDNSNSFHVFTPKKRQRKIQEINDMFIPIYEKIFEKLTAPEKVVYIDLMGKLILNLKE